MLLSTMTSELAKRTTHADAIRTLAEIGYDAYDFTFSADDASPVYSEDYKEYAAMLKDIAEKNGIICNQAHAVYPSALKGKDDYNAKTFEQIIRNMEFASLLGAKHIIVHPICYGLPEKSAFELNMELYNNLLPYCKQYGIKVALENMWDWDRKRKHITHCTCSTGEKFAYYLDNLDPDWFIACLDLGHCGLSGGEAQDMIRILGKDRLKALHVHDNNYVDDSHVMPYSGDMEWEEIFKALAEIGYEGELTYEADSTWSKFPDELVPEGIRFMEKLGRYMIGQIEKYTK